LSTTPLRGSGEHVVDALLLQSCELGVVAATEFSTVCLDLLP
jgi:hypothetical protein